MASALNEESVEKKLKTVNNTQDSIQSLSLWIIHHKSHHDKIVELWLKVLKKTGKYEMINEITEECTIFSHSSLIIKIVKLDYKQ